MMNNTILCQELIPENYTAIYARHSNNDKSNFSNVSQISICKQASSKLNLIVYKSYEDEGSAYSVPPEKRKGFKQLILDAKAGYFKILIIWRMDRLWRKSDYAPPTKKLLESLGVKLIFQDMIPFENTGSVNLNFMSNIYLAIAELEPNRIRERVIYGKNYKRSLGIIFLNLKSFGYTSVKDRNEISSKIKDTVAADATVTYFEKNPIESAFVNSCFQIYKNTSGEYNERLTQIKKEVASIRKLFEDVTITNFKEKINNIPNKKELLPIKNALSDINIKEMSSSLNKCCSYCTNSNNLKLMLKNHHHCGINIIDAENNDNLLILNDKNSKYVLNNEIFNIGINVDPIVDINLWFEVATHILICESLQTPEKTNNILGITIKCTKCKSKFELSNDLYECPKCHFKISTIDLKNKIIDELIKDDIYKKIMDEVTSYLHHKNEQVISIETELKTHETNCADYTLQCITKSIAKTSEDLVKAINSEAKEVERLKVTIVKLQQEKQAFVKIIYEQSPHAANGTENLKQTLSNFFINNKSELTNLLKNVIKDVSYKDGKIENRYSTF